MSRALARFLAIGALLVVLVALFSLSAGAPTRVVRLGVVALLLVLLVVAVRSALPADDGAVVGDRPRHPHDDGGGDERSDEGSDDPPEVIGARAPTDDGDDRQAYGVGKSICSACGQVISGSQERCADCADEGTATVGQFRK